MGGSPTEEVVRVEARIPEAKEPVVIVGLPEVGLVGLIVAAHMVGELEMREIGYIESDYLPPITVVHGGEPKEPVRVYSKGDVVVISSDVAIPPPLIGPLAKSIVSWAKSAGSRMIIGVTGLPVPNRIEIDKPRVFGVATNGGVREELRRIGVAPFEEGLIVGIYAMLLKESIKAEQPNVTLLCEAHYQFPDPGASASAIEAINKLLNLNISTESLLEKAEEIRIKAREIMRRTEQTMRDIRKLQERDFRSIYV